MARFLHHVLLNLQPITRARAAWSIVVVLLALYAWVFFSGGYEAVMPVYELFGLQTTSLRKGDVWQLITYGFLHGNWQHVGLNAACVLLIGAKLEWQIGVRKMLFCAFAGVLGGAVMHLLIGPKNALLVGFSGGCAGLLLLLTTLSPGSRMFPLPISARSLGVGILISEMLLALIDPSIGFPVFSAAGEFLRERGMGSVFEMGHACHVGGGLIGWWYGRWLLRPRVTLESLRRERQRRER